MTRGHEVTIFCSECDGTWNDLSIVTQPSRAWTNHGRTQQFAADLARTAGGRFDIVGGFNTMPGLDVLYCADPPATASSGLGRFNPRRRAMRALEASCFAPGRPTRLLLLSSVQKQDYQRRWSTEDARIDVLPPTIEPARIVPRQRQAEVRATLRARLGLDDTRQIWLFVGTYPQTKGLDRIIAALDKFPDVTLLCVGVAAEDARAMPFREQAGSSSAGDRIRWLGPREDVPDLMVASDLLVHPSRLDITGTVILEAMANGCPVITTAVCGYAPHVSAAGAGIVIAEPFAQNAFEAALHEARTHRARWSGNALAYCETTDITSGLDRAADAIASARR
jgi:UDP-glucose:(heptosyl)LPS alpha-1,3-glucosyltransferase